MNSPTVPAAPEAGDANAQAMLFASLVMQQTQMAMVFLGQAPNPQTGQTTADLDTASVFIDTLEMLAAKTKGNLTRSEEHLLQQSLTNLRMAFVAAVDAAPQPPPAPAAAPAAGATPTGTAPAAPAEPSQSADPAAADDPRKKFVKKY